MRSRLENRFSLFNERIQDRVRDGRDGRPDADRGDRGDRDGRDGRGRDGRWDRDDHDDWRRWNDRRYGYRHSRWHRGYFPWLSRGYGWRNYYWNRNPAAYVFGLTWWGLNRNAYGFGYWDYYNPYYNDPYTVAGYTFDFTQPLVVYDASMDVRQDIPAFDQAREAFYNRDYGQALRFTNAALQEAPRDPYVHEFLALVLFARGEYRGAAAALHSVLAVTPGMDWATMRSLYPDVDTYTQQLRALEAYYRDNPNAAEASFVLAYHYMATGYTDVAAARLREVVRLQPDNRVAAELLKMLEATTDEAAPDVPPEPTAAPQIPEAERMSPQELVGSWQAVNADGETFELSLTQDGHFTWTFGKDGKSESIQGLYAFDQNVLVMEPTAGGELVAHVRKTDAGFHFALVGAPENDPGLLFRQK